MKAKRPRQKPTDANIVNSTQSRFLDIREF